MRDECTATIRDLYAAVGHDEHWSNACVAVEHRAADEAILKTHLEIAAGLHERMLAIARAHALYAGVLDVIPFALILVDVSGQLLFVHRRAHAVLTQADGLAAAPAGLVIGAVTARDAVRQAIGDAIRHRQRTSVLVPRDSGRPGYILAIAPVEAHGHMAPRAAAVIVNEPDANPELDQAALRSAYGLTRAEAALVTTLVHGRTLEEAADVLCVSLSTVKTHLQRIFFKTDTDRQAELVRRVLLGHLRID